MDNVHKKKETEKVRTGLRIVSKSCLNDGVKQVRL